MIKQVDVIFFFTFTFFYLQINIKYLGLNYKSFRLQLLHKIYSYSLKYTIKTERALEIIFMVLTHIISKYVCVLCIIHFHFCHYLYTYD